MSTPKGNPPGKAKHLVDGLRPPPVPQSPLHYVSYLKAYEQYMLASVHFARIEQRLTRRDGSGPAITWSAHGQSLIVPSDQTNVVPDGAWLRSQPLAPPVASKTPTPEAVKPSVEKAAVPPKQQPRSKGKAPASVSSTVSSAAPSRSPSLRSVSPAPPSVTEVRADPGKWNFVTPANILHDVKVALRTNNSVDAAANAVMTSLVTHPVVAHPTVIPPPPTSSRTGSSARSYASAASSGASTPTGPESTPAPSEKKVKRKKRLTPAQRVKRDALKSQRAEKLKEDLTLLRTQNAILAASKRQEKLRAATKALGPGKGTSLASVLAAEKQGKHIKRVRKSPSYRRRLEKRRVQRGLVPPTPGPSQP